MVNGESKVSEEVSNRILQTHKEVNLHWLLTGDGEMFIKGAQEKPTEVNEPRVTGKGRLEDLEERVERLEVVVKRSIKDIEALLYPLTRRTTSFFAHCSKQAILVKKQCST